MKTVIALQVASTVLLGIGVALFGCQPERGTIVVKHDSELLETNPACSCDDCDCRKVDVSVLEDIADGLEAEVEKLRAKCREYEKWAEDIVEYCRGQGIRFEVMPSNRLRATTSTKKFRNGADCFGRNDRTESVGSYRQVPTLYD